MTDQLRQDAQQALEALETCREDEWHSEDDFGMEQTYDEDKVAKALTALRTTLKQPAQQAEPLEYWNAVEGWVKIDEVREHFDSVGCGTIYKTAGEDRVPLYTTPPQRPWQGLTDEEIAQGNKESWVTEQAWQSAVWWAEAKLKEKNYD